MSFYKHKKELLDVLLSIRTRKLLEDFLVDLLTPKEMLEVVARWQLVKQLHRGVPQRTIAKNLGVSIDTITRGSRELLNKAGGFNLILNKLAKRK